MVMLKRNLVLLCRSVATAAVLSVMAVEPAVPQQTDDGLNLGMLHWIRNTVCTGAQEIVFVPVSHDVRVKTDSYAMIDLADPDPDSAHIVNAMERHWLRTNGCDPAKSDGLRMAGNAKSGDLDL